MYDNVFRLNNLVAASVDSEIALRKGFEHLGKERNIHAYCKVS